MFVTISLTAGTVVIGAAIVLANAGMTWFSGVHARKRQKAQHEYEEKALREGHLAAMQQFLELCNVKKKIAEDEFKRNVELLKQQQRQSLRDVGYFSSLDEWPLQIPPMVMRNDILFLSSNEGDVLSNEVENMFSNIVMQVEPVHIIMSPCRDVYFRNSFHDEIERNLSSFFDKYWGASTMRPVIFYKQCWKDKTQDADEITVRNMFSKINAIPTIIINPVVGKDSLRFEASFWNIFGDNREDSFPKEIYAFEFGVDYSKQNREYLTKEIVSFLMSLFSMLVDQYYWRRYHFAPHQPDIIKQCAISYSTQEIDSLYKEYFQFFSDALSSSSIHPLIETDETLNYCKAVDVLSDKGLCFKEILRKLSNCKADDLNQLLLSMPFIKASFSQSIISFCKLNQPLYSISNETISKLQYKLDYNNCKSALYKLAKRKIMDESNEMPYNNYSCKETNAYKKISGLIENHRNAFWISCRDYSFSIVKNSETTSKYTDKRDWARKRIEDEVEKRAEELKISIMPKLYLEINEAKKEAIHSFVKDIVNDYLRDCQQNEISDNEILNEVSKLLYEKLVENYVKDFVCAYESTWNNRPAFAFADKVVNVLITYVFLSEDIVYTSSEVSEAALNDIKKIFMDCVWERYVVFGIEYALENIFDGGNEQLSSYDDNSSSSSSIEWSFGDPISETFGIY